MGYGAAGENLWTIPNWPKLYPSYGGWLLALRSGLAGGWPLNASQMS